MSQEFRNDAEGVGSPFQYSRIAQPEMSLQAVTAIGDIAIKKQEEARRRDIERARSKLGLRHSTINLTTKEKVVERMRRVHPSYASTQVSEPVPVVDSTDVVPAQEARRRKKKKCEDAGTVDE